VLALTDPHEAYRRSQIDARVAGGRAGDLVLICVGEVVDNLGAAIRAHYGHHLAARSKGLTRALTALTALEMGVDRQAPLAGALLQLYGAARERLLDSAVRFDADAMDEVRGDFRDLRDAFGGAR